MERDTDCIISSRFLILVHHKYLNTCAVYILDTSSACLPAALSHRAKPACQARCAPQLARAMWCPAVCTALCALQAAVVLPQLSLELCHRAVTGSTGTPYQMGPALGHLLSGVLRVNEVRKDLWAYLV